jgi:hypothetical protein
MRLFTTRLNVSESPGFCTFAGGVSVDVSIVLGHPRQNSVLQFAEIFVVRCTQVEEERCTFGGVSYHCNRRLEWLGQDVGIGSL